VTKTNPFAEQANVRGPWRRFLDAFAPLRPSLHRYCVQLTGNVWDGEDLMQDTLLRVFGYLGKIDRDLDHPRAYFIRTATHLWIDQIRRADRHRSWLQTATEPTDDALPERATEVAQASEALLSSFAPRERAAVLLCDVLEYTAAEAAATLQVSDGAVKAALHRARTRRDHNSAGVMHAASPPKALVERFLAALANNDMDTMQSICAHDLTVELVGGARGDDFESSRSFFAHAHWVPGPEMAEIAKLMKLGSDPHWQLAEYLGEWIVLGFRTLDGVEGLNEVHRIDEAAGKVARIRCYCFCPDTVRAVAEDLGLNALPRPFRSPDPPGR